MPKHLSSYELAQFTGSEQWYQHPLVRAVLYTDGVKYVAEHGGAYWLIDEIALAQTLAPVKAEEFQVWILKKVPQVIEGRMEDTSEAWLIADDGNSNEIFKKNIPFTDFPITEIKLYCEYDGTHRTIMLPSER